VPRLSADAARSAALLEQARLRALELLEEGAAA
jgi:hypothetical protein